MTVTAEEYSDVFTNGYFQFSRKLLLGIGQWPYASRLRKYLCRVMIVGVLLNGTPFVIKEFLNRWRRSNNSSMHCIPPILTQIACLVKFLNFTFNESQIRILLSKTYETWKMTVEETQRDVLISYGEYAKYTSRLYAGCLYIAMVFFLLMPMAPAILDLFVPLNESRTKHLVYPADYGISTDGYYVLMMLHAYICTFAAITIIVASDVFFICLVCHACCLFAIVRHCLQTVDDGNMDCTAHGFEDFKPNKVLRNSVITNFYVRKVAYSIKCHNKALKYSKTVEDTFTWSLFIILGINMIIISLTGFQALTQKDKWDDILICVTYIFGQLCHLFLLSLPGQLLVDESGSVRDAV